MKRIILALLICLPIVLFGQDFSENIQRKIDSMNLIIVDESTSDTTLAESYLGLSGLLYVQNIDTMIPLCNKVIEIAESNLASNLSQPEKTAMLNHYSGALNNIAYAYMTKGEIDKCLSYLKRSLKIYEKTGNKKEIATAINNIGFIYQDQGNALNALDYYQRSLEIEKEFGDALDIATSLNNIASLHKEQGEIEKALEYYQRSLPLLQEIGNKIAVARVENSIGGMLDLQGKDSLALNYYFSAISLQKETGDEEGLSNCFSRLARFHFSRNNLDSALFYHTNSLEIRRARGFKDGIAISTIGMAKILFQKGNVAAAKKYAKESLVISQDLGFPRNIMQAAELLSEIYERENNSVTSLKMMKLYIQMKDSINVEETKKSLLQQQSRYEYETKKKEDDLLHDIEIAVKDEKIKSKENFNFLLKLLLGLGAISLVVIIERLYRVNRLKSKLVDKNIENERLVVNLESTVQERTLTLQKSLVLLEEKEKNYGNLLDKSSEMIQMLDPEGNITYVNQAWLDNMKYGRADEVKGKSIMGFFNKSTLQEFQKIMPRLSKGELIADLECQFISKYESEVTLKGRARPIFRDGVFSGSQAFFFNVTEVLKAKIQIDQMASFKEIMLNITTEYINAPISEIDNVINASLLEIAKFSSADRAYVFKYNYEKEICSITHELSLIHI